MHSPEAMEVLHESGAGPVLQGSPCTHTDIGTTTYVPLPQQVALWKRSVFGYAEMMWECIPPATWEHFWRASWTVWIRKRLCNEHIPGDLQVLRRPQVCPPRGLLFKSSGTFCEDSCFLRSSLWQRCHMHGALAFTCCAAKARVCIREAFLHTHEGCLYTNMYLCLLCGCVPLN